MLISKHGFGIASKAARLSDKVVATRQSCRQAWKQPRRWMTTGQAKRTTALLFPGQGVQKVGMLDPWIKAFPRTTNLFLEEVNATLNLPVPVTDIVAKGPAPVLTACENSQSAIFITSMVILRVLQNEFGFDLEKQVDYILGHSLGEFAALAVAGCISLSDAVNLCQKRADVMAECSHRAEIGEPPPDPFEVSHHHPIDPTTAARTTLGMVALLSPPSHQPSMLVLLQELLALPTDKSPIPPDNIVQIGNLNSPNQIVLSGHIAGISAVLATLKAWSGFDSQAVRLNIAAPFHTSIMKPAEDFVRTMMKENDMAKFPGIKPVISNVSAREFSSADDVVELLARQATEMVDWAGSIEYVSKEKGVRTYIALGPGRVGAKLVSSAVGLDSDILQVADPRDCEKLMKRL